MTMWEEKDKKKMKKLAWKVYRSTKFDVLPVGSKSAYQRFLCVSKCVCHITVLFATSDTFVTQVFFIDVQANFEGSQSQQLQV